METRLATTSPPFVMILRGEGGGIEDTVSVELGGASVISSVSIMLIASETVWSPVLNGCCKVSCDISECNIEVSTEGSWLAWMSGEAY